MGLVAVGADRYVLDMLLDQGRAVYALGIYAVDFTMALLTPMCVRELVLSGRGDGMRPVAVGADRRLGVPLQKDLEMDPFEGLGIFVEMAAPAAF